MISTCDARNFLFCGGASSLGGTSSPEPPAILRIASGAASFAFGQELSPRVTALGEGGYYGTSRPPTSNAQHCRGCGGTSSPTKKLKKQGVAGRRLRPAQGVDAYWPKANSGAGGAAPYIEKTVNGNNNLRATVCDACGACGNSRMVVLVEWCVRERAVAFTFAIIKKTRPLVRTRPHPCDGIIAVFFYSQSWPWFFLR